MSKHAIPAPWRSGLISTFPYLVASTDRAVVMSYLYFYNFIGLFSNSDG